MVGVSTSEITDALRKASRLRGEVEQLEREAPRRRSLAGRIFSFVTRALACFVIIVLAIDGWFAYDAFRDETPGSGSTAEAAAEGPTYSDLVVFEDFEQFAGRLAITNPFPRDIEVFVDVDLYDGEQAVGELHGSVTLRPDSTSVVELDGFDEFVDFTESRVHLDGWAASTPQERAPRRRRRDQTVPWRRPDGRTRRHPRELRCDRCSCHRADVGAQKSAP